jgi:hypothetical protein
MRAWHEEPIGLDSPTEASLFPVVTLLSSEARMPLPLLEMDFAVSLSSSAYGFDTYGLDFEAPLLCAANTASRWCAMCSKFGCLCRIQRRSQALCAGRHWVSVASYEQTGYSIAQQAAKTKKQLWLGCMLLKPNLDKDFAKVWSPELECGALSIN